ncbi:hypothetical protein ACIRU8_40925 [Streptomyces sp. NPDC101175]|uniref:hypothetical protein n=1 Tax=Streptomyces sp. NPDC101175 TaxID=3366123 RepID=UPI003835ADFB
MNRFVTNIQGALIPAKVDPEKLKSVLEDFGWRPVGGRAGSYTRLAPPGESAGRFPSLVLPLDSDAPDYSDVMGFALSILTQDADLWTRFIYPRLAVATSDEFKFRKESSAPSGLIPWRSGEMLVESARLTLLAGAKSFLGPERHFVNRHGRFANRYLDQILMGQTAPGSYIVTAYAPPHVVIPLKGGADVENQIVGVGTAQVREVTEAVVRSVGATVEALDHYRRSGSLAGFEDGVSRGISYEMTNAILGIAVNSDEADIAIEWDPTSPPPSGYESSFRFTAPDVEPLSHAAVKLAEDKTSRSVTIMGRVHLLAKKEAGSPGVFGLDSLQSEGPRKVRVRLANEDEYHLAVRAHDDDLAILVSGTLEKEANLNWLYNASMVRTLGSISDYANPRRRKAGQRTPIPGQTDIFEQS